jgi:hypothetical protein
MEPGSLLPCAPHWVLFSAGWLNSTISYNIFVTFDLISSSHLPLIRLEFSLNLCTYSSLHYFVLHEAPLLLTLICYTYKTDSTNNEVHRYVILHSSVNSPMFVSDNLTWTKMHESVWRISARNLIRILEVRCLFVALVHNPSRDKPLRLVTCEELCTFNSKHFYWKAANTVSTSQVDTK